MMSGHSASFLEHSQKVYELDKQYTRCQQPSVRPYKKERGHLGGYCCVLKDREMYRAELTVHVITAPQLRTVPTHACGITWEPIPLPLLPCPQIDRCQ